MFAFLDDSGDSGFKFNAGSTRFVVMSACIFENKEDVSLAWERVECARNLSSDGIHFNRHDREFKYNKTKKALKTAFFESMKPAKYHVRAIVLDKQQVYSRHLLGHPGDIKSYLIRQLFTHTFGQVKNASLVIDGRDTRAFGMRDREYIMHMVNRECPRTLSTVEFADSKENPMIQLADMTAGAIRAVNERGDAESRHHFETFSDRLHQPGGTYWHFRR